MSLEDTSSVVLHTSAADRYLDRVSALIRGAHLNAFFPPTEQVLKHLSALHSRTHGGLYSQLTVHRCAGLPTLEEWNRVKTDAVLAEAQVLSNPAALRPPEATASDKVEVQDEERTKWEYCLRLSALELSSLEMLAVELRRLDSESGALHARLVFDTVDIAGLLVRCTIELAEARPTADSHQLLLRKGDDLYLAAELRSRLLRLVTKSAEQIFVELSALPEITVQRVTRACIGPLCLGELPAALPLGPLLTDARGGFATFALDIAAREVPRDCENDPLPHVMLEQNFIDAASEYERQRVKFGYRVYRDRKFVTDTSSQPAIESLCRSAGTRNIIYTTALASKEARA